MIRYLLLLLGPASVTAAALNVMSPEIAGAIGIAVAVMVFVGGELWATTWTIERRLVRRDLAHALLSAGTAQGCLLAATVMMGEREMIATALPLAAQVAGIVIGSDFLSYWAHRAQHRSHLLWRPHAIHHIPSQLYWLNGLRAHPLDSAWSFAISTGWVLVCGFSVEAFVVAGAITTSQLLMQHTRMNFPRSLEAIVVTPAWHRVHHHIDGDGANLAQLFTLWDRLFGTFQPSRSVAAELGIREGVEDSLAAELWFGFGPERTDIAAGAPRA